MSHSIPSLLVECELAIGEGIRDEPIQAALPTLRYWRGKSARAAGFWHPCDPKEIALDRWKNFGDPCCCPTIIAVAVWFNLLSGPPEQS